MGGTVGVTVGKTADGVMGATVGGEGKTIGAVLKGATTGDGVKGKITGGIDVGVPVPTGSWGYM